MSSPTPSSNAAKSFLGFLAAAEGGETNITLATGTKTNTRSADYVGTIEQGLEELPRTATIRSTHPNIGSVLTTIAFIAKTF